MDDDIGDELPPTSVVGPDAKGIKTVTSYRKNEKGELVKTITRSKFAKVERKVYRVRRAETCLGAAHDLSVLRHGVHISLLWSGGSGSDLVMQLPSKQITV